MVIVYHDFCYGREKFDKVLEIKVFIYICIISKEVEIEKNTYPDDTLSINSRYSLRK